MGTWEGEAWVWTIKWRRPLYTWEKEQETQLLEAISKWIPNKGREDTFQWHEGSFTVKKFTEKFWENEYETILDKSIIDAIWKAKATPRDKMLVWQLMINKLKTGEQLRKRKLISEEDAICPFCQEVEENSSHLMFTCIVTWNLWMRCFEWWGIQGCVHEDPRANIVMWKNLVRHKRIRELWRSLFFIVTSTIWQSRNKHIFEGQKRCWNEVFEEIKMKLGIWANVFHRSIPYHSTQFAMQLQECLR